MKKINLQKEIRLKTKPIVMFIALLATSLTNAQTLTSGLIGANYWMPAWEHEGKIEQVWNKVKELHPQIIRIGGNACRGVYYGVDTYDEMLDSVEAAGALPLIQISGRWTKNQRQELLNHLKNRQSPLVCFSINNEEDDKKFDGWLQKAVEEHTTIAQEIRDVFPKAVIAGPAFKGFDPNEIINHEYFLRNTLDKKDKNGKYLLNIHDIHTYTTSLTPEGEAKYDISVFKQRIQPILAILDSVNVNRSQNEKVSWMVSEFNINYRNDGQIWIHKGRHAFPETHKAYSFYAGQYWAQMFGFGIEKGAFAMIPWSVHESKGERVSLDLGMFDNNDAPYIPRSTYHHMKMLSENLKKSSIEASSNKENVEIVALADETGVTLMVMNTGESAYNMTITTKENKKNSTDLLITVNGKIEKLNNATLPANSTMLLLYNDNKLVKKVLYTKEFADERKYPGVEY